MAEGCRVFVSRAPIGNHDDSCRATSSGDSSAHTIFSNRGLPGSDVLGTQPPGTPRHDADEVYVPHRTQTLPILPSQAIDPRTAHLESPRSNIET